MFSRTHTSGTIRCTSKGCKRVHPSHHTNGDRIVAQTCPCGQTLIHPSYNRDTLPRAVLDGIEKARQCAAEYFKAYGK